jgi:hypothetical protein
MGDEERADDLLLVQRALLRVVGDHHDGPLVDHLVEQLVRRQDLVERLLEGDAAQLDRVAAVLVIALEGDVDPSGHPHRAQDVAQAGVVEDNVDWIGRGRIEQRFGGLPRRLLQLLDGGPGTLRLRQVADAPLHLIDLAGDLPIGRVVLAGAAVFAQRVFELAARLEQPRLVEVQRGCSQHRPLERNLVVDAIGIFLDRPSVVFDRGVPVAGARRVFAPPVRPAGAAARQEHGDRRDGGYAQQ